MSYSSTSAAATSSCVESGLDAQRTTSAPPAFKVRARLAVSVVTCKQAEIRYPESGCSRSKRSRMAASTGIWRSAHSIRRTPSGASARSFTSCRFVVAIQSSRLGGQEPLVLALLPVEGGQLVTCQPGLYCRSQLRLALEPSCESDVGELHVVAPAELPQGAELIELEEPVQAIAGPIPPGEDEPCALEVAEHPRRPARLGGGFPHGDSVHPRNLNTSLSMLSGEAPASRRYFRGPP